MPSHDERRPSDDLKVDSVHHGVDTAKVEVLASFAACCENGQGITSQPVNALLRAGECRDVTR